MFTSLLPLVAGDTSVRHLRAGDLPRFHAYRSDAELARYQGWSPMDAGAARAFLDEMSTVPGLRAGDWVQLGIADTATDGLVGDLGLFLDVDGAWAEVGFTVRREAQRAGHATRAVRCALELVFAASPAREVLAITDARNAPSIAVLERTGFEKTAVRDVVFKGEPCTEFVYRFARP